MKKLGFSPPAPGMFDAVGLRQKRHRTGQLNDTLLAVTTAALFTDGLLKPQGPGPNRRCRKNVGFLDQAKGWLWGI